MKIIDYSIKNIDGKRLFHFDELEKLGLRLYLSSSDFFSLPINESERLSQLQKIYSCLGIERSRVFSGYQVHGKRIRLINFEKEQKNTPNDAEHEVRRNDPHDPSCSGNQKNTQKPNGLGEQAPNIFKKPEFVSTDRYYSHEFPETDGLITDNPSHCLVTKFADCTPIVLFDKRKKILASLHSGWRGTQQRIAQHAIEKLTEYYFCSKQDLIAFIGPAISSEDFEVGMDLVTLFNESYGNIHSYLKPKDNGKLLFDMQRLIVDQLILNGIREEHIYCTTLETYRNPMMHSYRRDKERSGRMLLFALQKSFPLTL